MVGLIHHLPTSIIHRLLLQLKLPVSLTYRHTIGHGAIFLFTLLCVDLEEGPNTLAHIAPAGGFDFALCSMLEESLHLGAVGRLALGRPARRGV